MTELTITINREDCIACGTCYSLCPVVFEEGEEEGKSQIIEKYRKEKINKGEVPEDIECVWAAEENCPMDVITVDK